MRIVVCVKQTYDPATVKISRSREDFDLRQAVTRSNPLDRYALEAALQLRDATGGEVIALTAGDSGADDVLREAVAMGADRGLLLAGPELPASGGAAIAKAIVAGLERLGIVDMVLTGQADPLSGTGSLAARLAGALNWPVVLDAVCLEPARDGSVHAVVPNATGAQDVTLSTPAVVEVAPGAGRPRWPSARSIANVYRPGLIEVWTRDDLGAPDIEAGGLVLGPERVRGQCLSGTSDEAASLLMEILRSKRVI